MSETLREMTYEEQKKRAVHAAPGAAKRRMSMGVYINGMEMPTTCRDCRLSTLTDFDSMPFCNITMNDICFNDWETKRCDNCPLVPVPPHGRLINADALIVELMDRGVEGLQTDDWHEIQQAVADAPTIIPASEEGE